MVEKIVLTVVQNDQLIPPVFRIERQPEKDVKKKLVYYNGKGTYKSVVLNRGLKNENELEKPSGKAHITLEFTCHLVQTNDTTKQSKERRQLSFWFIKKVPEKERRHIARKFFQELLDPETFPKDMVEFIKKLMLLVESYKEIHNIDVYVERKVVDRNSDIQETIAAETCTMVLAPALQMESPSMAMDQDEGEGRDCITNFVTVLTPNIYDYQFVPQIPVSDKDHLVFTVKAKAEAHIALSAIYGSLEQKTYEITIGGKDNTRSWIRENAEGPKRAEAFTKNILDPEDSKRFWVSWKDGIIEVGEGGVKGMNRFLYWKIPAKKQHAINCMAVSTDKPSNGEWEFQDRTYPEKNKEKRRQKIRASLLWFAKKQRLINALEDSYPDSLPMEDLLKTARIQQSDTMTAVVMLRDLMKKNLIQEVAKGVWMRMPAAELVAGPGETKEMHPQLKHEIKIVKDMPRLSDKEQPTIAVITALYPEKLAVDAMIENKITYVRYVKQGDSSVYTLGKIGNHNVVTTKLSRVGIGRSEKISAGNAVTRLLGIFSKIDHVLIVGVAGGVPAYDDYYSHCRLGDIVVSVNPNPSGPLYIYCDKITMVGNSPDNVNYVNQKWSAKDLTLQNITAEIFDDYENSHKAPWEKHIEVGKEILRGDETGFYRPASKSDKLLRLMPNGEVIHVNHPEAPPSEDVDPNLPRLRHGVIGAGKFIARNKIHRENFAEKSNIKAYDNEFNAVLESIEGNRIGSFLIIRGIADYADGTKQKDWQHYAALVAAAYMKVIVLAI